MQQSQRSTGLETPRPEPDSLGYVLQCIGKKSDLFWHQKKEVKSHKADQIRYLLLELGTDTFVPPPPYSLLPGSERGQNCRLFCALGWVLGARWSQLYLCVTTTCVVFQWLFLDLEVTWENCAAA